MDLLIKRTRSAEAVGQNHPDKQADQYSDLVLDHLLNGAARHGHDPRSIRSAAEVMINGHDIFVGGEITAPHGVFDAELLEAQIREKYVALGNDPRDDLNVKLVLRPQAPEIASMTNTTALGAGDQGIMKGFATTKTASMLPLETELAWALIKGMHDRVTDGTLPWGREDTKAQVCLDHNDALVSVVMSVQHREWVALEDLRADLMTHVIRPALGDVNPSICKLNHKGTFVEGGADADCGLTGRKIIVDAYGPNVCVGGGAYSGKDPSKVDRSGAYAARQIAHTVLNHHPAGGTECEITLAYGIGQIQPEILTAIVDGQHDVSDWVAARFPDNSPTNIQERLGLWDRAGWTYADTAAFGHYGRGQFPWEHGA